MEIYILYFGFLAFCNAALIYHRFRRHNQDANVDGSAYEEETIALPGLPHRDAAAAAAKFKRTYFSVYVLATAADWLQGPYMYTLYAAHHRLPASTIAALFTTGFVSAALSASFVGSLADTHGRKAACLGYCVVYSLSCLSVLSGNLTVLFAGRALGGVSTTLLFSVFETWMIAEFHKRELGLGAGGRELKLGEMFSLSVTLSCVTAIVSGVIGEALVKWTDAKTAPFMAAVVCLLGAGGLIAWTWDENHGTAPTEKDQHHQPPTTSLRTVLADKRILTLGLVTTVFEGSMYLFVFFWSPAISAARASASSSFQSTARTFSGKTVVTESAAAAAAAVPFGLIFANFMCCMMLGSLLFSTSHSHSHSTPTSPTRLLLNTLALSSIALLLPVLLRAESSIFWSFALFELCVGLYFPTMSRLKSEIVGEAVRGKVYGCMRVPLNLFVVGALGMVREGDAYRDTVFTATGALLLVAFVAVGRYLD